MCKQTDTRDETQINPVPLTSPGEDACEGVEGQRQARRQRGEAQHVFMDAPPKTIGQGQRARRRGSGAGSDDDDPGREIVEAEGNKEKHVFQRDGRFSRAAPPRRRH